MESKPISFAKGKKLDEEINSYLASLKYGCFAIVEKENDVLFNIKKIYSHHLHQGFVIDDNFYIFNYKRKKMRVFRIRDDGFYMDDPAGLYVIKLFDLDLDSKEVQEAEKEKIINNLIAFRNAKVINDNLKDDMYDNNSDFLDELELRDEDIIAEDCKVHQFDEFNKNK